MMICVVPRGFDRFSDFYPVYLQMHDHPANRALHVAGNLVGLVAVAAGLAARSWWPVVGALVLVNGIHWFGHTVFQKNRPGDSGPRFWAALASWKMAWDFFFRRSAIRPEKLTTS